MRCALYLLLLATLVRADELTQKLVARLAEEADAFQRVAPQVLGREVLHQKALRPPPRFRARVGAAATKGLPLQWQDREVTSEYAFAALGGEGASIHELRQVVNADGKPVQDAKKAQLSLAKIITSNDIERKRQLLKDFEKYGLLGAVTDFGQFILLFQPRSITHFEFKGSGVEILGDVRTFVFSYRQIDGVDAVTYFDESKRDAVQRLRPEGQIWVRADNFMPLRISMAVSRGEGKLTIREEATVFYEMSRFGALLPAKTEHRELHGGMVAVENHFAYSNFQKFGAASDISFEVEH